VAAPWKPLAGQTLRLPDVASHTCGGELFPFTLSYAPANPKPGDEDLATSRRRTIVLAAPSVQIRSRWLAALARKAHSPGLRSSVPARPTHTHSCLPSGRRIASLGEEHIGLPMTAGMSTSLPRLPAGPTGLWDSHSNLHIVRDLYDCYAADPLSQESKGHRLSMDSSSSGAPSPSTSKAVKPQFLERYLDRQVEIEKLLEHKWSGEVGVLPPLVQSSSGSPTTCTIVPEEPPQMQAPLGGGVKQLMASGTNRALKSGGGDFGDLFPRNTLELAAHSENVTLEGDLLSNARFSGGAIFAPPNKRSWRLTIAHQSSLEEFPLILGLAPPDADLEMVSFFSSGGGVWLCVGGRASDDFISALGAPGGPAFFCRGERRVAHLPNPKEGQSISVRYREGQDLRFDHCAECGLEWKAPEPDKGICTRCGAHVSEGRLNHEAVGEARFFISSAEGQEVGSDQPPFALGLPLGAWRPCVLLCMPGTRVRIVRLV